MKKPPSAPKDQSVDFMLEEILENSALPQRRFLFWTLAAFMLCLGLWTFFGRIDVVVSSQGIAVPDGDTKIVQAVDPGSVSRILVLEGAHVNAGEVVLEIDPSMTETDMESKQKNLATISLEMERIQSLLSKKGFHPRGKGYGDEMISTQRRMFESIRTTLRQERDNNALESRKIGESIKDARSQEKKVRALIAADLEKKARLEKVMDIIPREEYDRLEAELIAYEQEASSLEYKRKSLELQLEQLAVELSSIKDRSDGALLKELADLQKQHTALNAEVGFASFRHSKQQIKAPASGYVSKAMIHTLGAVVTAAQPLFEIVPDSTPLMIKATVLNKDVGLLKSGKEVAVKVDAFDYQKYGSLVGVITEVGKNSHQNEKLGLVYEIRIALSGAQFPRGNGEARLEPGMTVVAEVKVGRRRIVEFFLYPLFRYFNEGLSVT